MKFEFIINGKRICIIVAERNGKKYARACPYWLYHPSPAQLAERMQFSKLAFESFGQNRIKMIENIRKGLKGKTFNPHTVHVKKYYSELAATMQEHATAQRIAEEYNRLFSEDVHASQEEIRKVLVSIAEQMS